MTGLAFPKGEGRKRRKQHKESILHRKDGTCYLCMKLAGDYRIYTYLEEHHIFGGPNRRISEAEGMKVYLCRECHQGKEGVHADIGKMRYLQKEAQREYEKTHTREQFMDRFGRNYL